MFRQLDIDGNPYVGVFCASSEDTLLVPGVPKLYDDVIETLKEALEVDIVEMTVDGSSLVGALVAMNKNGALLPDFATSDDLALLKEHGIHAECLKDKVNACGNIILANDTKALVNPKLSKISRNQIEDVLGVEVLRGRIAGKEIVGSCGVATNSGILCHPDLMDDEKDVLKELFGLPVAISTANYGAPYVGSCLVANTKGAVVGTPTTGIELNRIEDALDLIK